MKRYRIIDHMGAYFIEESRTTIFGKTRWCRWKDTELMPSGLCYDLLFLTQQEAHSYLANMLNALKEREQQERRGPRVVEEV